MLVLARCPLYRSNGANFAKTIIVQKDDIQTSINNDIFEN